MNRNDGARSDVRKARESARQEAGDERIVAVLREALHAAETSGGFWGEHPECEEFAQIGAAALTPWLARVIADAKAEAWDEGAAATRAHEDSLTGWLIDGIEHDTRPAEPTNPYRGSTS